MLCFENIFQKKKRNRMIIKSCMDARLNEVQHALFQEYISKRNHTTLKKSMFFLN